MPIYESAAGPRLDEEFEPGTLRHLVAGVPGRLLDPRRTPVSVMQAHAETGFADIRVEGFEDAGAIWQIPLEHVSDFQFELEGPRATDRDVAAMEAAIERLARPTNLATDPADEARTESRVTERRAMAARWLSRHSRFLAAGRALPRPTERRGDPALVADLEAFMRDAGLWDMEDALTRVFVSNPGSGELVKGHRIVLAELGLADYSGTIARDPATFEGPWARELRAEHIVARLAFVRALFRMLGIREVTLWRGASTESGLRRRPGRSFRSTSFDEAVARSHYETGRSTWTHALVRQDVPIERLFMTYHETAAMNGVFLEAEAALLAREGDGWP